MTNDWGVDFGAVRIMTGVGIGQKPFDTEGTNFPRIIPWCQRPHKSNKSDGSPVCW